jgi:hypothetical protein
MLGLETSIGERDWYRGMIERLLHVRVDEEIGGCVLSGLDEDGVSLGNPD